jgi:hypothetical protein
MGSFKYIVPCARVEQWLQSFTLGDDQIIDMPYEIFMAFIRRFLEPIDVEQDWYAQSYPGVASSISRGVFRSASHHFLAHGYFEHRLPFPAETVGRQVPITFRQVQSMIQLRPTRRGAHVSITRHALFFIIRALLRAVPVDETWYREAYPTAAKKIARGVFADATAHFSAIGYLEGLWPFPIDVDEAWYLGRYPDVRQMIAGRRFESATAHFRAEGYREGRFPHAAA